MGEAPGFQVVALSRREIDPICRWLCGGSSALGPCKVSCQGLHLMCSASEQHKHGLPGTGLPGGSEFFCQSHLRHSTRTCMYEEQVSRVSGWLNL